MKRTKSTFLALSAVLLSPMALHAEQITVTYQGVVYETAGAGFGYAVGDPISGSFVFDTEDLTDVNGDGSYFESAGPVSSDKSTTVEIYPDNLDAVRVWNFEQYGYDDLLIADATVQYGDPLSFTIWHSITIWDFAELFDLSSLPVGGLSFLPSSTGVMGGNVGHRTIDSQGYVDDQFAKFDITDLHIEGEAVADPAVLLQSLLDAVDVRGYNLAPHVRLMQQAYANDSPERVCTLLDRFDDNLQRRRAILARMPAIKAAWAMSEEEIIAILAQAALIGGSLNCN